MGKAPQTPPGTLVRRVFINPTHLRKKTRLGNKATAFSRKKSKNKCIGQAIGNSKSSFRILPSQIIILWFGSPVSGEEPVSGNTSFFNEQWLDTLVSIEVEVIEGGKGDVKPVGTGFLVETDGSMEYISTPLNGLTLDVKTRVLS